MGSPGKHGRHFRVRAHNDWMKNGNCSSEIGHGSASVALLYGDSVPHPFLGRYPRLNQLHSRGDLVPSITPAELYRQVLQPTRLGLS